MADVDVTYGCGFRTKRPEAAEEHSDRTGHKMTVLGMIKPSGKLEQTTKPVSSENTSSKLDELRRKLNGGE